jgi:hypothetical protein
MELKKGEVIIKTGKATYKGGSERWSTYASYGTLYLTNQRLVFEFRKSIVGMFLRRPKDGIEIPLAAIRNVQPGGKEIPLGLLVVKVDYSSKGESKFLLFTPIGEHFQRYGSEERVAEWLAPIRRMAKLPAESDIDSSAVQIRLRRWHAILFIIILLLVIIALGIILLPMIFGTR